MYGAAAATAGSVATRLACASLRFTRRDAGLLFQQFDDRVPRIADGLGATTEQFGIIAKEHVDPGGKLVVIHAALGEFFGYDRGSLPQALKKPARRAIDGAGRPWATG